MITEELLDLIDEALAVFGPQAEFVAASPRFREIFFPIASYLTPGTSWDIVLAQAERQGVILAPGAQVLARVEESLREPGSAPSECEIPSRQGMMQAVLSATGDGGFAMRVALRAAERSDDDSDLEQIMSKVLEACPVCLTMARIGDGQILYRSPEATALLGKHLNSRDHFAFREERADFITVLLARGSVDDMSITARRGGGQTFPASISARLIDYRGDDVIVASISDLTDELVMRAELDRQKAQVFQSEKMAALGEMLAGIAHELNNPLSIVVGNTQLLVEDMAESAERKRLEKISVAAERCVGIVRAFLSMVRDRPLKLERVRVQDLMQTACDAFQATSTDEIEVEIDVPGRITDVAVDEVQMVQVISNLMVNARDALKGQADGRIRLEAGESRARDEIWLRVSDNGPGVPDEVAPRIFDPLFTTKEVGKGTGIGLALCHRIVASHGGQIELDPTTEVGASIVVKIPI